jgi:hypothetical protein
MDQESSVFCIAFFGYVYTYGRGTPTENETIAGPVMIFTDEVIWIRPPLKERFKLAAAKVAGKAPEYLPVGDLKEVVGKIGDSIADRYVGASIEETVRLLNGEVRALVKGIGGDRLTSSDAHKQFGDWCDAQANHDINKVSLTKKGWLNPVTRITFYSNKSLPRHADVSPSEKAKLSAASDLTKAFGSRVVVS